MCRRRSRRASLTRAPRTATRRSLLLLLAAEHPPSSHHRRGDSFRYESVHDATDFQHSETPNRVSQSSQTPREMLTARCKSARHQSRRRLEQLTRAHEIVGQRYARVVAPLSASDSLSQSRWSSRSGGIDASNSKMKSRSARDNGIVIGSQTGRESRTLTSSRCTEINFTGAPLGGTSQRYLAIARSRIRGSPEVFLGPLATSGVL